MEHNFHHSEKLPANELALSFLKKGVTQVTIGGTNAINSLYTVKQIYKGKFGDTDKETFLKAVIANFEGYGHIHTKCSRIAKFGNGDTKLNKPAGESMALVFTGIMQQKCYRTNSTYTGCFMPAIVIWVDRSTCGKRVGAAPDGRVLGQATVDSCGPMQGTDPKGQTSVTTALSSPPKKCISTCVLNLRPDAANFKTAESTKKVQPLFETCFLQGGCQLQINPVDPDTLPAAMADPNAYRDIIVRVGGFSDNFILLNKDIQQESIKRPQHNL